MSEFYYIPDLPLPYDLETKEVMKHLVSAHRYLAQLHGVARIIPNEKILISTLTLQEAKESSSVENIVTTQDDLLLKRFSSSWNTIRRGSERCLVQCLKETMG